MELVDGRKPKMPVWSAGIRALPVAIEVSYILYDYMLGELTITANSKI